MGSIGRREGRHGAQAGQTRAQLGDARRQCISKISMSREVMGMLAEVGQQPSLLCIDLCIKQGSLGAWREGGPSCWASSCRRRKRHAPMDGEQRRTHVVWRT